MEVFCLDRALCTWRLRARSGCEGLESGVLAIFSWTGMREIDEDYLVCWAGATWRFFIYFSYSPEPWQHSLPPCLSLFHFFGIMVV